MDLPSLHSANVALFNALSLHRKDWLSPSCNALTSHFEWRRVYTKAVFHEVFLDGMTIRTNGA
jgi:hypothetical protein